MCSTRITVFNSTGSWVGKLPIDREPLVHGANNQKLNEISGLIFVKFSGALPREASEHWQDSPIACATWKKPCTVRNSRRWRLSSWVALTLMVSAHCIKWYIHDVRLLFKCTGLFRLCWLQRWHRTQILWGTTSPLKEGLKHQHCKHHAYPEI